MNGHDLANGIAAMMMPKLIGCAVIMLLIGSAVGAGIVWLFY